jgi:hypothetical protein
MHHAPPYPLGNGGDAKHRASVVIQAHNIAVFNAPGSGVPGMNARRVPVIPVFLDAMAGYLA